MSKTSWWSWSSSSAAAAAAAPSLNMTSPSTPPLRQQQQNRQKQKQASSSSSSFLPCLFLIVFFLPPIFIASSLLLFASSSSSSATAYLFSHDKVISSSSLSSSISRQQHERQQHQQQHEHHDDGRRELHGNLGPTAAKEAETTSFKHMINLDHFEGKLFLFWNNPAYVDHDGGGGTGTGEEGEGEEEEGAMEEVKTAKMTFKLKYYGKSAWLGFAIVPPSSSSSSLSAAGGGNRQRRQQEQEVQDENKKKEEIKDGVEHVDVQVQQQNEEIFRGEEGNQQVSSSAASSSSQLMIGSDAIIGIPKANTILKYHLSSKSMNQPRPSNEQTLLDSSIISDSVGTTMTFTKYLVEDVSLHEPNIYFDEHKNNTFLYAVGSSDQNLGHHELRGAFMLNLRLFTLTSGRKGVYLHPSSIDIMNSASSSVQDFDATEPLSSSTLGPWGFMVDGRKRLWAIHGAIAIAAWGICAPFAVTIALARSIFTTQWFKVHKLVNMACVCLTIIAFTIAVIGMCQRGDSTRHFSDAHHVVGLILLIISLWQVLSGLLRPEREDFHHGHHKHHHRHQIRSDVGQHAHSEHFRDNGGVHGNNNEDDDEYITAANTTVFGQLSYYCPMPTFTRTSGGLFGLRCGGRGGIQCTPRRVWARMHKTIGICLLGLAVWQIHDGLSMMSQDYGAQNLGPVYLAWKAQGFILFSAWFLWRKQRQKVRDVDDGMLEEQEEGGERGSTPTTIGSSSGITQEGSVENDDLRLRQEQQQGEEEEEVLRGGLVEHDGLTERQSHHHRFIGTGIERGEVGIGPGPISQQTMGLRVIDYNDDHHDGHNDDEDDYDEGRRDDGLFLNPLT